MSQPAEKPETVILYTDAPAVYDGFGTRTVNPAAGRTDRGAAIRTVEVRPEALEWQTQRYLSGCYLAARQHELPLYAGCIELSSDDLASLRESDVFRVLDSCPEEGRQGLAAWITAGRPDLAKEVAESLADCRLPF